IKQLQAKDISFKINKATNKLSKLDQEISECQEKNQGLKDRRDTLLKEKSEIDTQRRELEETLAEKGSSRLLELQRMMGDVSARIAGFRANTNASEANIKALHKQKNELTLNSADISQRITECRSQLPNLTARESELSRIISDKQKLAKESSEALTKLRQALGEQSQETEAIDEKLASTRQRLIRVEAQIEACHTRIDLFGKHLNTLSSRKAEYENLTQNIKDHILELKKVEEEKLTRATENNKKITEYKNLIEQRAHEIEEAEVVAKRATSALIELETQRKIADNLASEDKSLGLIEEMSKAGALTHVYGRLRSLIKFNDEYAKAVEAAAAGWMKALVVKDIGTALACIEVLKKTRVGRIKLLPVEGTPRQKAIQPITGITDILGPITDYLTFEERFAYAVNFVFGDTILTLNQKAAFLLSLRGVRAVALTGDLYEAGGAMETGYFRQPIDFTNLLLSGQTINELKSTLASLEKLATKTKEDSARLQHAVEELGRNETNFEHFTNSTRKELETFTSNLDRTERALQDTISRIEGMTREIATAEAVLSSSINLQQRVRTQLSIYEKERDSIKSPSQSATFIAAEDEQSKLANELTNLLRQRIELESKIQSLTSTISVLEPSSSQITSQIVDIEKQVEALSSNMEETLSQLHNSETQLKELEETRNKLTDELGTVKSKRDAFDNQLEQIESEITNIIGQLDPLANELAQLIASQKNTQMQIEFHTNELKELGISKIDEVSDEDIENITKTLTLLKKELSSLGAINQLAVSQYEEVKENYKHLATRIYEIEKEKLSIIQFMNELDKQKFDAFMKAFNQVSQSFNEIFSTVTSGSGRLFLEDPEKPFEAGADIRLQFPGKTEMTIGSASGGEKSVGTVCFILALQSIHPMPFYMMDEIDAHLDVVNSQRLAELLKRNSQGSQFIIVSLKDVTITRGDAVFGVFIQDGVSQVINLPMQEVKTVGRTN
ncbi:MAG TPA: chromosome segregation SMC family protein, partial [Candidatus Bathyarchaeia archaeon]|nr:chromosome segregation SMC family protein [Candidatus Bathyarchaeia archaeon]